MAHRWITGRAAQSSSVTREGAAPRRLEQAASSRLRASFSYQIGLIRRRSVVKTQDTAPGVVRRGPRRSRGARKGSLQPREAVRVPGDVREATHGKKGEREKKGRAARGREQAPRSTWCPTVLFPSRRIRDQRAEIRAHLAARLPLLGSHVERQSDDPSNCRTIRWS